MLCYGQQDNGGLTRCVQVSVLSNFTNWLGTKKQRYSKLIYHHYTLMRIIVNLSTKLMLQAY